MSKTQEALKLALEALEWINRVNAMEYEYKQKARESLNAIYDALADKPAQQEPVSVTYQEAFETMQALHNGTLTQHAIAVEFWKTKLYTSPPAQQEPLTDEQIAELMKQTWGCASIAPRNAPAFARAIEAKLREKNDTL